MVLSLVVPSSSQTSCMRCDRRFVPRSESSAYGTPQKGTTSSTRIFTMSSDCWLGITYTIGHLVNKSWTTRTCLLPCDVIGRSITSTPMMGSQTLSPLLSHASHVWVSSCVWVAADIASSSVAQLIVFPHYAQPGTVPCKFVPHILQGALIISCDRPSCNFPWRSVSLVSVDMLS